MSIEDEEKFERTYGVPVNAHGSVVVARWGTALGMLFVGIAFSVLLLSYFYLRLENPHWPPSGTPDPSLGQALIAGILIVASGVAVYAAQRRIATGDRRGLIAGLGGALILAGAAIFIQWGDIGELGLVLRSHAYGSIFYTIAGFATAVALGAMIMLAMIVYWSTRGFYSATRHAPVANASRFWMMMVLVWLVGFTTLYVGPHLT